MKIEVKCDIAKRMSNPNQTGETLQTYTVLIDEEDICELAFRKGKNIGSFETKKHCIRKQRVTRIIME